MELNLVGKVAIVTGASRGIGRAIALALAREGAKVVVNHIGELPRDDDPGGAEEVVKLIQSRAGEAVAIRADVSRRQEVVRMVERTLELFGRVDILVNNAGITLHQLMVEITDKEWDRVFDVNLRGCFHCSQLVARQMIRQGVGGRIINISSQVATQPILRRSAYGPSKAAIEAFTRCCALELGSHNITVNAVAPGATRTTINPHYANPAFVETLERSIPLGKIAAPEEIAGSVLFLASKAASHITGEIIHVDGGHSIGQFGAVDVEAA
jgi:3-oxoacyl-[acyl-carrier protein] reductase